MCDVIMGEVYIALGNFPMAEMAYEAALCRRTTLFFKSESEYHTEARVNLHRAYIKAVRGESGAVEICIASLPVLQCTKDVAGIVILCRTAGYAELWAGNYEEARKWFYAALSGPAIVAEHNDSYLEALVGMEGVYYLQGNAAEAARVRGQMRDILQKSPDRAIRYAAQVATAMAAYTAVAGDLEEAREQMRGLMGRVTQSRNVTAASVNCLYVTACIELRAHNLPAAAELFSRTIQHCRALAEVRRQAQALGGLGEIANLTQDMAGAKERFEEAKALCDFMGVNPRCLYSHDPYYMLRDMFADWVQFQGGQLAAS